MSVTRLKPPPRLAAETEVIDLGRGPETGFQRVRRLQAEARSLALEEIEALCRDINAVAARAAEVAEGGEAFPAGVRDMAARLAADMPERAQAMRVIAERMARARKD